MKAVLKYLFALCLFISGNQISTHQNDENGLLTAVENQQTGRGLDSEVSSIRLNIKAKSLLPTAVVLPAAKISKFGNEEEQSTNLRLYPNHSRFHLALDNTFFSYNSLGSIFKKRHTFSSYRRYLLFEVFRI
ncbi:hypothetical protein [Aurantibacter sp.]|uniref:hypothetical protein n=1 Tax=Aurantibacter sp. TaxID=2807103 RepID=UPI0032664FCC